MSHNESSLWIKGETEKWIQDPSICQEKVLESYEKNAEEYDKGQVNLRYGGPDILFRFLKPLIENKDELTVLDVGAGTGHMGIRLRPIIDERKGKLDALDPSENMLKLAPCGTYDNMFYEFVKGLNSTSLPTDCYDVVCSCGAFVPGHISPDGLNEFLRLTKIGGVVAMTIRTEYTYAGASHQDLIPLIQKLVRDGICKEVKTAEAPNYLENFTGTTFILEKLSNFQIQ